MGVFQGAATVELEKPGKRSQGQRQEAQPAAGIHPDDHVDGLVRHVHRSVTSEIQRTGGSLEIMAGKHSVTDMKRTELAFSQGYFNKSELKNQTILTIDNEKGKSVAFLNIVGESLRGGIKKTKTIWILKALRW